ncbi:MAG: hypothetical protein J0I23_32095, partial [Rhizobiales bacterium]|nr:hypothetical protein [Hyphomicrobiales bacterium]
MDIPAAFRFPVFTFAAAPISGGTMFDPVKFGVSDYETSKAGAVCHAPEARSFRSRQLSRKSGQAFRFAAISPSRR